MGSVVSGRHWRRRRLCLGFHRLFFFVPASAPVSVSLRRAAMIAVCVGPCAMLLTEGAPPPALLAGGGGVGRGGDSFVDEVVVMERDVGVLIVG